jgi:hypothetical protein
MRLIWRQGIELEEGVFLSVDTRQSAPAYGAFRRPGRGVQRKKPCSNLH